MTNLLHDPKLKFDEEKHVYKVGRKKLQSVTQFVKEFFPEFDAKAQARESNKNPNSKYYKMGIKKILALWKQNSDDGTETHRQLEEYIISRDLLNVEDQKAQWGVTYFDSLHRKSGEPIAVPECRIYSEELGLAGTIDVVFEYNKVGPDGRETTQRAITLIDWKTSKTIYEKQFDKNENPITGHLQNTNLSVYMLQLATYAYILDKEYNICPEQLAIVHLKDGGVKPYTFAYDSGLKEIVKKMIDSRTTQ